MKPIILLGEARGENEERISSSFVGASGVELLRMLHQAEALRLTSEDYDFINRYYVTSDPHMIEAVWRMHPEVYRTNVFNRHPKSNQIETFCGTKAEGLLGYPALLKSKYVRAEFAPELERLGDEIISLDPNLIVCLGNTPLWALAGKTGISNLRGTTLLSTHTVEGYKLLPTYHPAAVLRQWELRPVTIADLSKIPRQALSPELQRPSREIWIEPTLADLEIFYADRIRGTSLLAVDIETSGNQITCIGFAPSPQSALVVPFYDSRKKGKSYWPTTESELAAWAFARRILEDRGIRKIFQNGLYDIAFLWRSYRIRVLGATHDTMLLSHALQPESLKGLGFLGSIYTDEGAWKAAHRSSTIKRDE